MIGERLPLGNDFNFTYANVELSAASKFYTPDTMDRNLKLLVDGIQSNYVMPTWNFHSITGNEHFFIMAFTNPSLINLTAMSPDCDFINPDQLITRPDRSPWWSLQKNTLVSLLDGTNLYPHHFNAFYNRIYAMEDGEELRMGFVAKTADRITLYQRGVALIKADLINRQDKINSLSDEIADLTSKYLAEIQAPMQERQNLKQSVLSTPKPFPLSL